MSEYSNCRHELDVEAYIEGEEYETEDMAAP